MQYTGNYNLKKPEGTDIVDIDDLNDNADILDQALKTVEDKADSAPADSVNDAAIGNRTPDQTQAPASPGTGTLTQLISWLANRIKAITGKTNWWDTPPTTLQAAKNHIDAAAPHSGHETPVGAQAKADAAETNAKNHANSLVGTLSNLLTTAKNNVVAAINEIFGIVEDVEGDLESHKAESATQIELGHIKGVVGNEVFLGNNIILDGASESSIAIGRGSAIGPYSSNASIAIGASARAGGFRSIAIGRGATAKGSGISQRPAMALGANAIATNDWAIVIGTESNNTTIPGTFTVNGTKNFEIPHPKPEKKATHRIRHGAVESPTAGDTLYRYKIQATKDNDKVLIDLPDYFVWLNKDVQIFVTPQGHFGNGYGVLNEETEQLEIHCQFEGEYNVLVIGTRNDDHQSVQDWDIKGVEREIGESWTGETYAFSVDEIIEIEEIKEVSA